ncbi:MAG TPA: hypothetical protein EYP61_08470 [Candidatus Latescibacteria bacterium]|nr:hypothetical protein [Candidatus Latescibacterota bacterium]
MSLPRSFYKFLGLSLSLSPLSAQASERFTISTWPSVTYYVSFPYLEKSGDGDLLITAGGRYTVYLNGKLVGQDDDPSSVESYKVPFKRRENVVAVVVEHEGSGTEYGLFCVLRTEDSIFISSPNDWRSPYFWTDFPLENKEGAAWTKMRKRYLKDFEQDGEQVVWRPVQAGTLRLDFPEFSDLDLRGESGVAGFPGGMDGSKGGLRLRSLQGQNLAYGASSTEPKAVDGNVNTSVAFGKGARALFQRLDIDLGRPYLINRVRVITQPPSRTQTYEDVSLRGYSILVSKDNVNFLEVASKNKITTYQETSVHFRTVPARYVRLVVTEFANRNASPRVGEVEVYGEGIAQEGSYLSPPLDLGTAKKKIFGHVSWFGEVSAASELFLQFRSSDDGMKWSEWSPEHEERDLLLTVPEPCRYLQFRATMRTRDLRTSPRLDSLRVEYSTGPFPASKAVGSIFPVQVPMGVDTSFTYTLKLDVRETDSGVVRLVIFTPSIASFVPSDVRGLGLAGIDLDRSYATEDSLVITFDPPITSRSYVKELTIPFRARLLSAAHTFRALLYSAGSSVPFSVQREEGTDPRTGSEYTLTLEATEILPHVLNDVWARPPVFSPNSDEVNDHTVIEFTLAKVSHAPVRIEIYDLGGRLVRTLWDGPLGAGRYLSGGVEPGRWDGRDDEGKLSPPGVYLYRIVVDLEPSEESATGIVTLVY